MKRSTLQLALFAAVAIGIGLAGYGYGVRHGASPVQVAPAPEAAKDTVAAAPAERKVLYWHDPMVPGQKFDKPGKSPFMDMELVPVYADEQVGGGIAVSPAMTASLGMRTALARKVAVSPRLAVTGTVAENERASAVVQARTTGYIEKLYARANFDPVAAGAPVALIYAPEWAGPQAEYLVLRRAGADAALVAGARQRLRLASIPDQVVEAAERNDAPEVRYTLTAPRSGVVTDLAVRDGAMVTPGMTLMRVVSLGDVWIYAEIPEAATTAITVGANAEIRLPAYPDQVLRGKVSALLPQITPGSRTLRARIELQNPGGRLRPGMQVNVALVAPQDRESIVVPHEAVIATGKRTVVIVQEQDGRFRPVDVTVGRDVGSDVEIIKGLRGGDAVVSSGQFLLDSEASLKTALPRLTGGGDMAPVTETKAPAAEMKAPPMEMKTPGGGRP